MVATDEVVAEPVIASSNRALDVEPYAKHLFAENPKLWAQILPWEFPQNASKEREETFIRQFFDEREIRMQGGADGDGKGFRFLKSAWYWAALWNLNCRLPAIVDWWFAQTDNKALLDNPNFDFNHFLAAEAEARTFFEENEIDLYGEKILYWAVKQIQKQLRNHHSKPPASAATKYAPGRQELDIETPKTYIQKPVDVGPAYAAALSSAPAVPAVTNPTSTLSPTVVAFQGPDNHPIPQPRVVSGSAHPAPHQRQPCSNRRRVSNVSKRNSLNGSRQNQRLFGGKDSRFPPAQLNPYTMPGQPIPHTAPVPGHMPSGGQYPSPMDPIPPLPQGQLFQGPDQAPGCGPQAPSPYAQPYQPGYLSLAHHPVYQPGHVPPPGLPANAYHNMQQPFMDRSNGQIDARPSSNEGLFGNFDDGQFRPKQRQDSMSSRGASSRGYGSMRGRGARNKNSFGQSNVGNVMDPRFFRHLDPGEPNAPVIPIFAPDHGDMRPVKQIWRGSSREENFVPPGAYRGGDARRYTSAHEDPYLHRGSQFQPIAAEAHFIPTGFEEQFLDRSMTINHNRRTLVGPLCQAGCSRYTVGAQCTTARKVVIFNIPRGMSRDELVQRLSQQYGSVEYLSLPHPRDGQDTRRGWVTFENIASVRKILTCREDLALGIQNLTAELAREHYDECHPARTAAGLDARSAFAQSFIPPAVAPTVTGLSQEISREVQQNKPLTLVKQTKKAESDLAPNSSSHDLSNKASDQPLQGHCDIVAGDVVSEDTTPAPSSHNTPKKKSKSNKKKKQMRGENNIPGGNANDNRAVQHSASIGPPLRHDSVMHSSSGAASCVDNTSKDISRANEAPSDAMPAQVGDHTEEAVKSSTVYAVAPDTTSIPYDETAAKHGGTFYAANDSPKLDNDARKGADDGSVLAIDVTADPDNADRASPVAEDDAIGPLATVNVSKNTDKTPGPTNFTSAKPTDTDILSSFAKGEESTSHIHAQRYASSESEAAFKTAPQTPLTPEPMPESSSKKAQPKPKGPSQTESLSAYSSNKRQAKSKKSVGKAGSIKARPQKFITLDTVNDEDKPIGIKQVEENSMEEDQTGASDRVDNDQTHTNQVNQANSMIKKTNITQLVDSSHTEEPDKATEALVGPDDVHIKQLKVVSVEADQAKNTEDEHFTSETAPGISSRRPTLISKLSGFFIGKSAAALPAPSSVESSAAACGNDEQCASQAKATKPVDDGCEEADDASSQGNDGSTHSKNKKKQKKKSKPKTNVEVKLRSPLVVDTEKPGSVSEQTGNDASEDKPAEATLGGASRSGSVSRVFSMKDPQKSHIVEARPLRRKHKRVVSSKDSVNSHDSADETPLAAAGEAKNNDTNTPRQTGKILEDAAEEQFPRASPEVEAARARMEVMREREEQIKKEKAASNGQAR